MPTHIVGLKLHRIAPSLGIVVFSEHSKGQKEIEGERERDLHTGNAIPLMIR